VELWSEEEKVTAPRPVQQTIAPKHFAAAAESVSA